jgi:SET domain-containing protein
MLLIKTFLDRSSLHGIGLFANEDLKAGALVWEFNCLVDLKFTLKDWHSFKKRISLQSYKNLLQLSYKEDGFIYLCIDNAQFMNHSLSCCNIGHQGFLKNRMYALRTILKGEELLCNYLAYSDPDDHSAQMLNNMT